MGDLAELRLNRGVDRRMIVSVQVGPNRGIGIEIFSARSIFNHRSFAARDDNRFMALPFPHLGKWVPDKLLIKLSEAFHNNVPTRRAARRHRQNHAPRSQLVASEPDRAPRSDNESRESKFQAQPMLPRETRPLLRRQQ